MVTVMINALVECSDRRKPHERQAVLHHGAWSEALDRVQRLTSAHISKRMLQGKFKSIKASWQAWCNFCADVEGVGDWDWDEEKSTYVNTDAEAADRYYKMRPLSRPFRHRGHENAEQLRMILRDCPDPHVYSQWQESSDYSSSDPEEGRDDNRNTMLSNYKAKRQLLMEKRIQHRELHARRKAKRFSREAALWAETAAANCSNEPNMYEKRRRDAFAVYKAEREQLLPTTWFDDDGKLISKMAIKADRTLKHNPSKLDIWMNVYGFDMKFRRTMLLKLLMETNVITKKLYEEQLGYQFGLIEEDSMSYYSSEWEYANESV